MQKGKKAKAKEKEEKMLYDLIKGKEVVFQLLRGTIID